MPLGFFHQGARVTGQTPTNIALGAAGLSSTRSGGGTRLRKVFHSRFVEFFRTGIRKISPRKHRILNQGAAPGNYLLARKNDPGNIRLNLVGRLRGPGLAGAFPPAPPRSESTHLGLSQASDFVAGAGAATQSTEPRALGQEPPAAPTLQQRLEQIGARSTRIEEARDLLRSQDPALRLQARVTETRLMAEILADFRVLADPALAGTTPEALASAREQLTRQIIELKLPESARELDARRSASESADGSDAEIAADDVRRTLHKRYQHTPPQRYPDEPMGSRLERGDYLWPSPPMQPEAFLSQVAKLLTELAAPRARNHVDAASGSREAPESAAPEPIDPRLVDRLFEQAGLQQSTAPDEEHHGAKKANDALVLARNLLWMLAQRGSTDRDPQLRRFIEGRLTTSPDGRRIIDKSQMTAPQRLQFKEEVGRRLAAARLQAYCDDIDGLFAADASLDERRLQLKFAAASNAGERELVTRNHDLGLATRNLVRAWTIHARHGGGKQSALIQGSRVRIDEKLLQALIPRRQRSQFNSVSTANTRDVNLLVAHAISLQKAADEQVEWLAQGETTVVPKPSNDVTATNAVTLLFDATDLRNMGFGEDTLAAMRADGSLTELLDASRALASAGLQSTGGVARIDSIVSTARKRLIDNTLATQGLRDLAGPEARAEALVAIASTSEAARTPFLAELNAHLPAQMGSKQSVEYDRAGAAIARAYDDRVSIDREVEFAKQTLKLYADTNPALALNPSDRKTRELALQLREFREQVRWFDSLTNLRDKLKEATALAPLHSDSDLVRQGLNRDLDVTTELINQIRTSLTRSKAAIDQRADHPLLATHSPGFRGLSLEHAIAWIRNGEANTENAEGQALKAAEAIITVDEARGRVGLCEERLRQAARVQTRIIEQRRAGLPDRHRSALQLELRSIAASLYLEHLQAATAASQPATEFVLANHRERFVQRAEARGLPADRFGIEIDDMLVREFDQEALGKWISDTQQSFSERMLSAMGRVGSAADTPTLADANRATILGAIRQMEVGERVFLKASRTGEIGFSKIPADPTGTLKLDLMLGMGDRNVFDVKRKPNGNYTISIRDGTTLSLRAGISATPAALGEIAKVSGTVQMTNTSVAGCALEFRPDKGIAFVEHLLQNKAVDARLLGTATDIRFVDKGENKVLLEGAIGVSTASIVKKFEKQSKEAAKVLQTGLDANSAPIPSLGVSAKALWSRAWAEAHQHNTKVAVLKRSTTYQAEFSASVELTAKLPSLADGVLQALVADASSPSASARGDANPAEADVLKNSLTTPVNNLGTLQSAVSRIYEAELTLEQQAFDGSLRKAEFEFAVPLVAGLDTAALCRVDPTLRAQLERLPADRRAEFDHLLKRVELNEGYLLLATSQLDGAERDALNDEFYMARGLAGDLAAKTHLAQKGANALDLAHQAHGERLATLEARAAEFTLQRLIVVKGATMTGDQAFGIGVARIARQGQAGTGTTVGQVDLTASTAIPAPTQNAADDSLDDESSEQLGGTEIWPVDDSDVGSIDDDSSVRSPVVRRLSEGSTVWEDPPT